MSCSWSWSCMCQLLELVISSIPYASANIYMTIFRISYLLDFIYLLICYGSFSWVHLIFGFIQACWCLYQFHESFDFWFCICLSSVLSFQCMSTRVCHVPWIYPIWQCVFTSFCMLHPCFLISWIYCIDDLSVFYFHRLSSIYFKHINPCLSQF